MFVGAAWFSTDYGGFVPLVLSRLLVWFNSRTAESCCIVPGWGAMIHTGSHLVFE